ncbi:MAG: pimeloyl-ACP methyl ester carboxylesterase, partial [Paraglaciecola sp.]
FLLIMFGFGNPILTHASEELTTAKTTLASETSASKVYPNEKAIHFKNGEQSVDAYQGTIQVLENRVDPDSRLIPLSYVRFPATGTKIGSPIIYLAGGPGGSGILTASYPGFRFPLFMAMREFGDVIALDQRGTGKSQTAPKCTSSQKMPLNQVLTEPMVTEHYRLAAKECIEFWKEQGIDPLGYTTLQSVEDIEQLRQHFTAEKVSLWGISYGSHLALASLKTMSGKIDKVIIASAEGLNQTVKLPSRTDAYFERLQTAIDQQPKAAKTYPDIKALIRQVHHKLDTNPIALKLPQTQGEPIDFLFQRAHMQGIASAMIADPHRAVPQLLQLYSALDQGMTQVLPPIIKRAGLDDSAISFDVMSFAMDIASGITDERLNLFNQQAENSLVGKLLNFPMPHLNKAILSLDLGDEFRQFPRSDVPTLLLTGTLDGRTYIQSQVEATQGLTDLTHVIVKNAGHNLFMLSPKVTETIQQFMRGTPITTQPIEFKLPEFVD